MTHVKENINDVEVMLKNSKVFNGNVITGNIDKTTLSQLNMGYSSDGQMTSGYANAIEKLAISYNEATAEANALKMAQDGLSESTVKDILEKQNWSKAEMDAALSSQAFNMAQQKATINTELNTQATLKNVAATKALTIAKKIGSAISGMFVTTAIATGVSLLISGVVKLADSIYETRKEIKEAAEVARQSIEDIKSSFDDLEEKTNNIKQRYAELAQGVRLSDNTNMTLSNDEYKEFLDLSNQLAELFPTLTKNYDSNGNAILNLSGDVNSIVASLEQLIKTQRDLANEEMLGKIPDVYDDYQLNLNDYTQKLEAAKKKQEEYNNLYKQLKNAQYDVADDKKTVTFHFGNIDETEKANIMQELTSSFEDIKDYVAQDMGTLDDHDTTVTLYLENEFKGFEARLKSSQDEITKYTNLIKNETSSFSSYMNTWLQGNWLYQQQDESVQTALQQILFNKDWITLAKEELGEDAEWEQIASWIEDEYIKALSEIDNEEYKQKLLDLFNTKLTPEKRISLAQELQDYFESEEIQVSLGFILDENDMNSDTSIKKRFDSALLDNAKNSIPRYGDLLEFTADFGKEEMLVWLEVADGIYCAEEAIEAYNKATQASSEYNGFFTDDNNQKVDDYISKVSQLTEYYNKLSTVEGLTNEEKIDLNQTYGIVADSSEDYQSAILNELSMLEYYDEIIVFLKEAIENCTDAKEKVRLQTLLNDLTSLDNKLMDAATGFDNLANSMSSLQSKADLLRDIKDDIDEFGKIDISSLNEILSLFPELENQVALYNAGLMDSSKLFELLEEAYKADADLYSGLMAEKMQYNENFYSSIYEKLPQHIKDLADSYNLDIENYRTLCAAKLELEGELAKKRAELYDAITEDYNISKDPYASKEEKEQVHSEYQAVQKSYNEVSSIFDSIMQTAFQSFTTSWKSFGKDNDEGEKDKEKTKIDWIDQSLAVLQEKVDDAHTALENTNGFDAQLEAIDALNGALGELQGGYTEAYNEYSDRYTKGLQKLSNSDEIKKKIESGDEFKLDEYPAEKAQIIQELIDLYGKMTEAEDKISELGLQIDNNENIEKSKLRQEDYEKELDSIQTKLEDQTLTVLEKNDLLKDELEYQKKINEEMAVRAEYEGDTEGAATLRKKNQNLEQKTESDILQEDIALNDLYIETNKSKLNNPHLTKDEIDAINARDKVLQEQAFDYRFQEIRNTIDDDVWDIYIQDLREQYGELTLSEEELIDKYFYDIAQYFDYTGMEKLYHDKLNHGIEAGRIDYDTNKAISSYFINDNDNKIADIQHDIDYAGGRGTEQNYKDMKSYHKENLALWTNQRQEAEAMLKSCTEGTKAWDDWNREIQECDDKIAACERSIKDCEIAILKLPLNDIADRLMVIENQLDDINEAIEYNNTYISAANYILDKEVRGHEKAKELIQDQLDALEKVNNVRKSSLALQQAEYNLRRAEEQRSSKVFVEGKGWEYQSDPDELMNARANYDQAIYDNKVAQLNEQIRVHDEEVKMLNRIKDNWSWITTEAQGTVDVNKALLYDLEFESKVLSGNAVLVKSLSDAMKEYYSSKTMYEDEQKNYQKLEDDINDTVTAYELEAIGYEEAKRRITNSIKLYYPEIFEKYGEESEKIQEIINKKMEQVGIQEETSKDINDNVKESNKELVETYTKLVKDLDDVFVKLNGMLKTYTSNAKTMASDVSSAISQIQDKINNLDSINATISITSEPSVDANVQTAGQSHSGIELGYLGESSTSKDKDAFRYIALDELDDSELLRLVQKGEAVLTESQVGTVMNNFKNLAKVKIPNVQAYSQQTNQSVNFNGDIIIKNPVSDSNNLAREIKQNLGNNILQELYKK